MTEDDMCRFSTPELDQSRSQFGRVGGTIFGSRKATLAGVRPTNFKKDLHRAMTQPEQALVEIIERTATSASHSARRRLLRIEFEGSVKVRETPIVSTNRALNKTAM